MEVPKVQPVISVNGMAVINNLTPSARILITKKTVDTKRWKPTPHLLPINSYVDWIPSL